jgi:hypothetical protein
MIAAMLTNLASRGTPRSPFESAILVPMSFSISASFAQIQAKS